MSKPLEDPDAALAVLPNPDDITLLFKCHKSTVVLSVAPSASFSSIKALLLAALKARHVTAMPNSTTPLPEDPDQLEFGVFADKKDPSKGWVLVDAKEQDSAAARVAKKKPGTKASGANESPSSAGLPDGSVVAFRLKADRKAPEVVHDPDDSTPDIDIEEDPGWDVVFPTFEDDEME